MHEVFESLREKGCRVYWSNSKSNQQKVDIVFIEKGNLDCYEVM